MIESESQVKVKCYDLMLRVKSTNHECKVKG